MSLIHDPNKPTPPARPSPPQAMVNLVRSELARMGVVRAASFATQEQRRSVCLECEHLVREGEHMYCGEKYRVFGGRKKTGCGCNIARKIQLSVSACPLGKWEAEKP